MKKMLDTTAIDNACGNAMYNLTMDAFDMGDSAEDIVETLEWLLESNNVEKPRHQENSYANIKSNYRKLARTLPCMTFEQLIWFADTEGINCYDYMGTSLNELKYDHEVTKTKPSMKNTTFYKSLSALIEYLIMHKTEILKMSLPDKDIKEEYKKVLETFKEWKDDILPAYDMKLISIAKHVSERYYKELDPKIFGTLSNDFGTVGHVSHPEGEVVTFMYDEYMPMYTMMQDIYGSGVVLKGIFSKATMPKDDKKNYRFEIIPCKKKYVVKSETCVNTGDIIPENDNRFIIRFSDKVDIDTLATEIAHLYVQTAMFFKTRFKRLNFPEELMQPDHFNTKIKPYMTLK